MSNLEEFRKEVERYLSIDPDGWFIQDNGIRNPDEIAEDIISIAVSYGFYAFDQKTFNDKKGDPFDDDYSEQIGYLMDEAIEYLSSAVPDGYWIGNDGYAGGFGIWKCEDEE